MRYLWIALLLSGCAGSQFYAQPVAPGYSRVMVCPAPEYGICGWQDYKQVGPSSQGSFTEPKRH